MSAWESTRTPSLRKSASCSIIALRNNSESPILSSSATVHSPSVDWSLLKEPHGGRLRQWPLPFTHSRGHYRHELYLADKGFTGVEWERHWLEDYARLWWPLLRRTTPAQRGPKRIAVGLLASDRSSRR